MKYRNYQQSPRVDKLLAIISENPGFGYTDMLRHSGLKNGVLSHYLSRMEKYGLIRIKRGKRRIWFFPVNVPTSQYSLIINLRKETCKIILTFLLTKGSATFSQIVSETKRSPSTISITLSKLLDSELITVEGFDRKYKVRDPIVILMTLKIIQPNMFDKIKDRFADTFSYF